MSMSEPRTPEEREKQESAGLVLDSRKWKLLQHQLSNSFKLHCNKFGYFKSYIYICTIIYDISIVIWTCIYKQMPQLCDRLVQN